MRRRRRPSGFRRSDRVLRRRRRRLSLPAFGRIDTSVIRPTSSDLPTTTPRNFPTVMRFSSGPAGDIAGMPTLACEPWTEIMRPRSSTCGAAAPAGWESLFAKAISMRRSAKPQDARRSPIACSRLEIQLMDGAQIARAGRVSRTTMQTARNLRGDSSLWPALSTARQAPFLVNRQSQRRAGVR